MKGPTNSSARPNIRLLNVSATFESNPDTDTNTDFPYRATIDADGVSEYMSATVMFSQVQAISGNFATFCQTDTDKIYVYSKTNVGTITIPAVSCDLSVNYINVDNVPTEDSPAVITSGGVYDNCVRIDGTQNITGSKIFNNIINTQDLTKNIADARASDEWIWAGLEIFDSARRTGYIRQKFQTNNRNDFMIASEDAQGGSGAIHIMSDGYVTASTRAYNSNNTGDIVTIGTLNQNRFINETISSGKTFGNGINDLVTATVPQAGTYLCVGRIETASSGTLGSAAAYVLGIGQNTYVGPWLLSGDGAYDYRANGSITFNCNAGDVIHLMLYWSGTGNAGISGSLSLIRII